MKFSVIIPTYNRVQSLERTLQSILRQDCYDYELIVVNDGSTDETNSLLRRYEAGGKIIYLQQPRKGPASARNSGIASAKGEYIVFTDDDCIVPTNWLTLFETAFKREEGDAIGGAAISCVENNFFSSLSQEITNHFVTTLAQLTTSTAFLTSNNIAYKSAIIRDLGGFDERFRSPGGEERALHWRMIALGKKCVYMPEIIVEHYHTMSFRRYVRQQWNYGKGSYILYRIAGRENSGVKPIPISIYFSLIQKFFRGNYFAGMVKFVFFCLGQGVVACGFLKVAFSQVFQLKQDSNGNPE